VTLVDSSAWIEYLRATGSRVDLRLTELIEAGDEELLTAPPVMMELLAGAETEFDMRRVGTALAACSDVGVSLRSDWEDAAWLFLTCRRAGVTPRQLIDCLIAAVAIRVGAPVLAQDRDYELISEHTPLQLAS
jgi:predicted nucleic acid-binding protein